MKRDEQQLQVLSEMMDGEAGEFETQSVMQHFSESEDLQQHWSDWHAIRARLRGDRRDSNSDINIIASVLAGIARSDTAHRQRIWSRRLASTGLAACMAVGSYAVMMVLVQPSEAAPAPAVVLRQAVESPSALIVLNAASTNVQDESKPLSAPYDVDVPTVPATMEVPKKAAPDEDQQQSK